MTVMAIQQNAAALRARIVVHDGPCRRRRSRRCDASDVQEAGPAPAHADARSRRELLVGIRSAARPDRVCISASSELDERELRGFLAQLLARRFPRMTAAALLSRRGRYDRANVDGRRVNALEASLDLAMLYLHAVENAAKVRVEDRCRF